jgi:integrase/recombinase XerD
LLHSISLNSAEDQNKMGFTERSRNEPCSLLITDLDVTAILAFLDHLEEKRGKKVRTRNLRLAGIRTFFRFVALRDPERLGQVTQIMAIPVKRQEKRLISALTREEIEAILSTPDQSTWKGRRDYVLLLTMYNTGARVSEMTGLQREQVSFGSSTYIKLHGKGRKERTVPLWPHTARALKSWFHELAGSCGTVALPNARGHQMARDGVEYLLRGTVKKAVSQLPSLINRRISPHVLRHYVPFRTMSCNTAATALFLVKS